jgi:hypothetical protein
VYPKGRATTLKSSQSSIWAQKSKFAQTNDFQAAEVCASKTADHVDCGGNHTGSNGLNLYQYRFVIFRPHAFFRCLKLAKFNPWPFLFSGNNLQSLGMTQLEIRENEAAAEEEEAKAKKVGLNDICRVFDV